MRFGTGDAIDGSFSWFPSLPSLTQASPSSSVAAAASGGDLAYCDRKRMHGGAGAPALYQAGAACVQQQQQQLLQAMLDRKISDAVAACGSGNEGAGAQAAALTHSVSKYIRGSGDTV